MILTRAHLRDAVRRRLGIVPAVDVGGQVGEPLPAFPWPSNKTINEAIDDALAEINRTANVTSGRPYSFYVWGYPSLKGPAEIPRIMLQVPVRISDAYWHSGGIKTLLEPKTREEIVRDYPNWLNEPASKPRIIIAQSQTVLIWPAPQESGELIVYTTDWWFVPQTDGASITEIPPDYIPIIADITAANLAATLPDDAEMRSRAQVLLAKAQEGKQQILTYLGNMTNAKPTVKVRTYRWH